MPRYYKEHARGYDLDLELEFILIDGERCLLGTAGSVIMVCRTCGEEHFRDSPSEHERCFQGHGQMHPLKLSDLPHFHEVWKSQGDTITAIEDRRTERLAKESSESFRGWIFGDKIETDYPDGYVKSAEKVT